VYVIVRVIGLLAVIATAVVFG
jgi:hypothetical protein